MRDSRFDDILKNKLNGLTSDKQPDWRLFAQEKRIADMAMGVPNAEDVTFDDQIKTELDAYEAPGSPDWSAFLNKKTISDNNLDFDNKLKRELEQHTAPSEPQWGAFINYKNKLGEEPEAELSVQDFDADIRDTLEDYTTGQPQWSAFLDKKAKSDQDHQIDGSEKKFDDDLRAAVAGLIVTSPADWATFSDLRSELSFDSEIKEQLEDHTTSSEPQWDKFLDDREDLSFDNAVREEAEGHVSETEPQWEMFLDSRADLTFDTDLRAVMEGYRTPSEPQWDKFQNDRGDLSFDGAVRDTVDSYSTTSEPQWEKFLERKRREDSIVMNTGFDNGVSGSLGRLKVRYNSEHWLLLRSRLQKIEALRKAIFSYKGLEILFMSLLLFTMANHLSPLMDKLVKTDTSSISVKTTKTERQIDTSPLRVENKTAAAVTEVEEIGGTTLASESSALVSTEVATTPNSFNNSRAQHNAVSGSTAGQNNRNTLPKTGGNANENSESTTDSFDGTDNSLPVIAEPLLEKVSDKENGEVVARALMAQLDVISDGMDLMDEARTLKEAQVIEVIDYSIRKTYKDDGNWWHLFAAMESDLISTPVPMDNRLPARKENTFGYAFEGLYSVARGPWEYEAGLGYSFFKYTPHTTYDLNANGEPNEIYQTGEAMNLIDFTKISLRMVSVPLKLKRHFLMNGRWSIFGSIGINNDFLLSTKYSIRDEVYFPNPTGTQPPPIAEYPELYTERYFTKGLLNKDPLVSAYDVKTRSNFYFLRATIGAGAERNITDNVAAYVRADYYQTLVNREFGPFNDRINKLSFGMGFKFRVNR